MKIGQEFLLSAHINVMSGPRNFLLLGKLETSGHNFLQVS